MRSRRVGLVGVSAATTEMVDPTFVRVLASCFPAGDPALEGLTARGEAMLGGPRGWLRPLAKRYEAAFSAGTRPRHRDVVRFLSQDSALQNIALAYPHEFTVVHWLADGHRMQPVEAARPWEIPAIESLGDLANWLGVDHGELAWFADLKDLGRKTPDFRLRHYIYRILPKRSGGVRLIESPKPRLKALQRKLLDGILNRIPPHAAAHGFRRGRSIRTFAEPHVDRRVLLRMDLQDFFPAFSGPRVQTFLRTMGYPESVADVLGGICTNCTPRDTWRTAGPEIAAEELRHARIWYGRPHLPQGAPTSPALANLCAYRVDCRLAGLAKSAGAVYTRYADDLAFSGAEEFERRVERFSLHAAAILIEEGFHVNHRKTRIMRRGVRQQLAGLIANERLNVPRADFDRLKAILTNCIRFGPYGQNRDGHADFRSYLAGRVAFVAMIHPQKGAKLQSLLNEIQWNEPQTE